MATQTGKLLWESAKKAWGASENTTYASDQVKWLNRIHHNIYAFSSAKSFAQMKELRDAVFDANGKVRPFTEFRDSARNIVGKYNELWLQTEYEAVIRGSIMGRKWLDIERDKDILPYLRYKTAGDSRVRPEHRRLEGITLPVDSPFWKQYYPPNGWNCRCTVEQLRHAEVDDLENATAMAEKANIPDYWKRNVGTEEIFDPAQTPYFDAMPRQPKATSYYGMKSAADIFGQKLSNIPTPFESEMALKAFTDGFKTDFKDIEGLPISLDFAKYNQKFPLKFRFEATQPLTEALQKPSEIWEGTEKNWTRRYIKYYEDHAVVVFTDQQGKVNRVWFGYADAETIETFRNGILIKK